MVVTAKRPRRRTPRLAQRFYEQALDEAERTELAKAGEVEGVDGEMALLRLLLRTALAERPADFALMFRGIDLITRVAAARYRISKDDERDLLASYAEIVRGFGDAVDADLLRRLAGEGGVDDGA
jgi:hypothetical protein